jgi:hypothetical protein
MRVSKTHMLQETMNVSGPDRTQKIRVGVPKMPMSAGGAGQKPAGPKPTFTKVFRWRLPAGQKPEPATVEIVGTFTHWQKVPLLYDRVQGAWQVTLEQLAGNRTHHYMLLADGKPVHDRHCDGLAIPRGPVEEPYALATARGPRVFMLFAQTK